MICIKNKAILPDCPYCGAKLGYLETFVLKNRATYKCRSCGKKSCVDLKSTFYNWLWIIQVICVIIFVASTITGGGFALFGLFLIVLVFMIFYCISPYLVILKSAKKKIIRKKRKEKKESKNSERMEVQKETSGRQENDLNSRDIFSS